MNARRSDEEGFHATQFRCGMSLWRAIKKAAVEEDRSINGLITYAVRKYLVEREKERGQVIAPRARISPKAPATVAEIPTQ